MVRKDEMIHKTSIFISYSWDSKKHINWIKKFAKKLLDNNIFVYLDQWQIKPGDNITEFMKRSFESAEFILVVITDGYMNKLNLNYGVKIEDILIKSKILEGIEPRKIIPILRSGDLSNIPTYLKDKKYLDMRKDDEFDLKFESLLFNLNQYQTPTKDIIKETVAELDSVEKSELIDKIKTLEKILEEKEQQLETISQVIKDIYGKNQTNSTNVKYGVLKTIFDEIKKFDCSKLTDEKLGQCRNKKGDLLENFTSDFMETIPGFKVIDRKKNFSKEEIDLVLSNNSKEPILMSFNSPFIFVECKNWTSKVGKNEGIIFAHKIRKRKGNVKLGIFVAVKGYTKNFIAELKEIQREGFSIAILSGEDFDNFLKKSDIQASSLIIDSIIKSML